MKYIISGGTGFVGKWIVREIIRDNNEVLLLIINEQDKPIEFINNNKIKFLVCPLDKLATINTKLFDSSEYDVFVHLAWFGTSGELRSDEHVQLENVKYACDAVRLAKKVHAKRFINAGSIMEYESFYTITSNDSEPSSNMLYSIGKLTADLCCKTIANSIGIDYINVVIGNIYGVGEKSARFVNTIVRKMMRNQTIDLTHGNQQYDFIYASDAARAIKIVCENGKKNNVYYIGNSHTKPLKQFVLQMKKCLCSDSLLNFGAIPFKNVALTYKEFDIKKLQKEFSFIPKVSFNKGIALLKEEVEKELV